MYAEAHDPSPSMMHYRGGRARPSTRRSIHTWKISGAICPPSMCCCSESEARAPLILQLDDTSLAHSTIRSSASTCRASVAPWQQHRIYIPTSTPRWWENRGHARVYAPVPRNFSAPRGRPPAAMTTWPRRCSPNSPSTASFSNTTTRARAASSAALRAKGKFVVLGLVTTKRGQLESKDQLKRRIDEAARFVPLRSSFA